MNKQEIIDILVKKGLKVTPQRIAILEVVYNLKNHPTTENIIESIRKNNPNISVGTIYKTMETFAEKGIIKKMSTEKDITRYETVSRKHHHLYCPRPERIEDFYDEELDKLIVNYLSHKNIPDFKVEDIKIQIIGEFTGAGTENQK